MRAYIAHAMTGRSGAEMHSESKSAMMAFGMFGIEVLDPVLEEGVKPDTKVLSNTVEEVAGHWKRDKALIRRAHILVDLTPNLKSEGVSHEIGYARYFLWKPVIRVGANFPASSVAHFEDDVIAPSLYHAARIADERFGTFGKRFIWRVKLYWRCYLKACLYKLGEWK